MLSVCSDAMEAGGMGIGVGTAVKRVWVSETVWILYDKSRLTYDM